MRKEHVWHAGGKSRFLKLAGVIYVPFQPWRCIGIPSFGLGAMWRVAQHAQLTRSGFYFSPVRLDSGGLGGG